MTNLIPQIDQEPFDHEDPTLGFSQPLAPASLGMSLTNPVLANKALCVVMNHQTRKIICYTGEPMNQNKVNLAHAIATLLNFTPFLIGVLNDHQDELRNKLDLNEETFNDFDQEAISHTHHSIEQCRHIASVFGTLNREGNSHHATEICKAIFEVELPDNSQYGEVVELLKADEELYAQFLWELLETIDYDVDHVGNDLVSLSMKIHNNKVLEVLDNFQAVLELHDRMLDEADRVEAEERLYVDKLKTDAQAIAKALSVVV